MEAVGEGEDITLLKTLKEIFLIYKEVQQGAGAESYMRKGFPIYSMRKFANI
jgi:hypothetical protein